MKYLEVGKIVSTHGIKGEVKVKVITDDLTRFSKEAILFLGEIKEKIIIDSYRIQADKKDMILLAFNKIKNINDVLKYINEVIYVDIDEARKDDEIYYDDLIDCNVYVENEIIGKVIDIMEVPQGEILRIKKENGKVALVPYIDEFVSEVDIKNKVIKITPIEGLL